MTTAGRVDVLWLIEAPKLSAFLLNPEHRKGASRLKYLTAFGFSQADPKTVADARVAHAMNNLPGLVKPQAIGPNRVVFEGTVQAPVGRAMPVRPVWEVTQGDQERTMRFLTAIPLTR